MIISFCREYEKASESFLEGTQGVVEEEYLAGLVQDHIDNPRHADVVYYLKVTVVVWH